MIARPNADSIRHVEKMLACKGYLSAEPNGAFDFRAAGALMEYLKDNRQTAATLSPWFLQQMMRYGHREALSDMIRGDQKINAAFESRLRNIAEKYDTMSKTQLASAQILMRAYGLYDGPANGNRNTEVDSAIADLNIHLGKIDLANNPSKKRNSAEFAAHLAGNQKFRSAWTRGDMATVIRLAEESDTTPVVLNAPLKNLQEPKAGQGFGLRRGRLHRGVDYAAPRGTPVLSAADGRVVAAHYHQSKHGRSYGYSIVVDHGHGILTHYAHLQKLSVKPGAPVNAGQKIGTVGNTGSSHGNHLHFEVAFRSHQGQPIVVDGERLMNRNLRGPGVQFQAVTDANTIATRAKRGLNKALVSSYLASAAKEDRAITPAVAQVLVKVMEADPSLVTALPARVSSSISQMGYAREMRLLMIAHKQPEHRVSVGIPTP